MNPRELANEFYGMAHDSAMNIMDIFAQEDCHYLMDHSYQEKGICIHFMFRGECDYSLIVPWDYANDDNKIRNYYVRFTSLHAREADTITDVARIADTFIEQELQNLKG